MGGGQHAVGPMKPRRTHLRRGVPRRVSWNTSAEVLSVSAAHKAVMNDHETCVRTVWAVES